MANDMWTSPTAIRVRRALVGSVKSLEELMPACFSSKSNLRVVMTALRACGLVRIAGWRYMPDSRYAMEALYEWRDGDEEWQEDAARPVRGRNTYNLPHFETSLAADKVAEMIQVHGPLSLNQLRALLPGMGSGYLQRITKGMVDDGRWLHIGAWRREGGNNKMVAVFHLGAGKNVKRPERLTGAEVNRRRRDRLRKKYGTLAPKMFKSRARGGSDQVVLEGEVVYQRRGR